MFSKSFLVLAAVASCSYAQQSATDLTTGLDSITQDLSDLTVLVKDADGHDKTQTMINKYRDFIQAENNFNTQESPTSPLTEDQQTELCGSLKTSTSEHLSLLEAFSTQHDAIHTLYVSLIGSLLRSDESSTDYTTFKVSDLVPTCKETALEGSETLSDTFSDVIQKYSD